MFNRTANVSSKQKTAFAEPMEVSQSLDYLWEIKLDGYRAIAVKLGQVVTLHSRTGKSLNKRFRYIVEPLRELLDGTVVDGELIALDDQGRPTFNLLQNSTSEASRIHSSLIQRCDLTRLFAH